MYQWFRKLVGIDNPKPMPAPEPAVVEVKVPEVATPVQDEPIKIEIHTSKPEPAPVKNQPTKKGRPPASKSSKTSKKPK